MESSAREYIEVALAFPFLVPKLFLRDEGSTLALQRFLVDLIQVRVSENAVVGLERTLDIPVSLRDEATRYSTSCILCEGTHQ
jgi:hypothetical protein